MRSFPLRFLAAIPFTFLLLCLFDDARCPKVVDSTQPLSIKQGDTPFPSKAADHTTHVGVAHDELTDADRLDAQAELEQIRREIEELDRKSS